jgi:RNA polymerase primary sigma factor
MSEQQINTGDLVQRAAGELAHDVAVGRLVARGLADLARAPEDPLSLYLAALQQIPQLTREEEIGLAKTIEITRKRFRRKVVENHYAMRNVVDTLERVATGDLPFDRTVRVSPTENLEKDMILQRMPYNLKTLRHLMTLNVQEFRRLADERTSESEKEQLRDSLKARRAEAVILVEELSIRTQRVQPLMRKLAQISSRMDELVRDIAALKAQTNMTEELANLQKELRDLMEITLEEPESLRDRTEVMRIRLKEYADSKRALVGANLRLVANVVNEYLDRGLSQSELIQEGELGLMHAVENFEYRYGHEFSEYAVPCIRQAIVQAIAQKRPEERPEISPELMATLEKVLQTLTFREREIIKLRFGIGDGYTYTMEEISRIFKTTPEAVRQIEDKALRRLQHPARTHKLGPVIDALAAWSSGQP